MCSAHGRYRVTAISCLRPTADAHSLKPNIIQVNQESIKTVQSVVRNCIIYRSPYRNCKGD